MRFEPKICLISDHPAVGQSIRFSLSRVGYDVTLLRIEEVNLDEITYIAPDMIIIDLHKAADKLAIELCTSLRPETTIPMLVFLAHQHESSILAAYQVGADECTPNPVSMAVILAKVNAWMRRSNVISIEALDIIETDDFRFEPARKLLSVLHSGDTIRLTNLETRLLYVLMSHPGRTLENEYLISRVWGSVEEASPALLKNIIYRLRRKIEPNLNEPRYIHTEAGSGYKFQSL